VQRAVRELEFCKDYDTFSDIWYQFLIASKNIYTQLEQGAKSSAKSTLWFGERNKFRKSDQLLRYVTEARNSEEHGLQPNSRFVPNELRLGVSKPGMSSEIQDQNGNVFSGCGTAISYSGSMPTSLPKLQALDGKPILAEFHPAHVKLVQVQDRHGNRYDPPTSHLGVQIDGSEPLTVAKAMMTYLEQLLAEAESLRA
jgi:hypothetical protein